MLLGETPGAPPCGRISLQHVELMRPPELGPGVVREDLTQRGAVDLGGQPAGTREALEEQMGARTIGAV